jgi:hypothetical protein
MIDSTSRMKYYYLVTSDTGPDVRFPQYPDITSFHSQETYCQRAIKDAQERMELGQKNVSVQLVETFQTIKTERTYLDVPLKRRIWVGHREDGRIPDVLLDSEKIYNTWRGLGEGKKTGIKWYTGVVELTEVSG